MKKYKPTDPYKNLIHAIFERDYSVEGILLSQFNVYKTSINHGGRWVKCLRGKLQEIK